MPPPEPGPLALADTHCHLHSDAFDADRPDVITRAASAGIRWMLTIGTGLAEGAKALALAHSHPQISASVGLDPYEAGNVTDKDYDALTTMLKDPKVVALGEIGLEFLKMPASRDQQSACFRRQIRLACSLDLPIIIHTREAHAVTLAILREEAGTRPVAGVVHCYCGGPETALDYLSMGLHISLAGNVTYPRSEDIRGAAAVVPADRILVETDSPYLPPQGFRGQRCEPALAAVTLRAVAQIRGEDPAALGRQVIANAQRLFPRAVIGAP